MHLLQIVRTDTIVRSSQQRCSVRKGVLRNFTKFTGKHLCQSFFFNKVAGATCNFIKKETLPPVFSCEYCEIPKNTFFTEYLWVTASELLTMVSVFTALVFLHLSNIKAALQGCSYEKVF